MALLHLTLATRDVPRSQRFYEATLGWKPVERPNNIPMEAAWLAIGPGQELHLLFVTDFKPSHFEREFGRHVAISYPRADFVALQERLVHHGAELIAPLRPTPFARFFFRDPNGYYFEIIDSEGYRSESS